MAHFYSWFPGDYMRDTAHLSMVEDAAYRRLLDAYYMAEKVSANADVLLRVCRAVTDEEKAAVVKVASCHACNHCRITPARGGSHERRRDSRTPHRRRTLLQSRI